MKPVHQKKNDRCMRACVASILELPYDAVPDFCPVNESPESFMAKWREFTRSHGYEILWLFHEVLNERPRGYSIGVGKNKKGEEHAVVCLDGVQVFDPYLGGAPIEAPHTYGYFVAMNPKGITK